MELDHLSSTALRVIDEVSSAVVGKRAELELALMAMLADGHILLEDLPGVGKTLLARSFARAMDLGFKRIQFTPDLLPADVTGTSVYSQARGDFEFRPGPVFTHLLLADEINRAPAKTQAALLEAMQERQVTVDGETHTLPRPFLVIATQNPIEFEGTYPLPEAQLDRFLVRLRLGYPTEEDERQVLRRRVDRRAEEVVLRPLIDGSELLRAQAALESVHVSDAIMRYVVALVAATRASARLQLGASPRGALAPMKLARARAALQAWDFVVPDDVKAVAVAALAHRVSLKPELWIQSLTTDEAVHECLDTVPVPSAAELAREP